MENKAILVSSKIDSNLKLRVIPGHFVTSHSHVSCYNDVTPLKTSSKSAEIVAKYFSDIYSRAIEVDTIVCMDGTQVIGAYLAQHLSARGLGNFNEGKDIRVVTPETNITGQLIFRDDLIDVVKNKKIIILVGNESTGRSVDKAIDCINYYGGWVNGIGALFSAIPMVKDLKIDPIFKVEDLPVEYNVWEQTECPLCKNGISVDALVNSFGYSKLY